jgi:diguanylate cyclase (GGDEF)-like protein/PAS domain S-box-containing protein
MEQTALQCPNILNFAGVYLLAAHRYLWAALVAHDFSMPNLTRKKARPDAANVPKGSTVSHRRRAIRILFVHRHAEVIESCLNELKKAQFVVSAEFVLNFAQCDELIYSESYDLVIAEYRRPSPKVSRALQVFHQKLRHIPLLFIVSSRRKESLAQLSIEGPFGYLKRSQLAQLPAAVCQALKESELRKELQDARQALQLSQSLYRALADNPAYGVYRCNAEGVTIDVNLALVNMLRYANKNELLSANVPNDLLLSTANDCPPPETLISTTEISPREIEWKRKDGTILRVRLSGRDIHDENGNFAGRETIAVDVTEQRSLEEQLRHQASSDSLTGLANHRRFFETLQGEVSRSNRTGREFSLVLLDLDGLKSVNDQFGHPTGDRALCRLAKILRDCCRSIDTAARHGGDEFALLLPETNSAAATRVAHRISELLATEAEQPVLSVSFGIVTHPKDADTIAALLDAADRALYAMKGKRYGAASGTVQNALAVDKN